MLQSDLHLLNWAAVFPRLICGFGFGYFATISLVLFVFSRQEQRYLHLGVLGGTIGVWTLSHLPQELFGTVVPKFLAAPAIMYYSAFIAPISTLLFCRATFAPTFGRIYRGLITAHSLLLGLAIIAQVSALITWQQLNLPLNLLLIVTCGLMATDAVYQSKRGSFVGRVFLTGLICLLGCVIADTVSFSFRSWFTAHSVPIPETPITQYGIFIVYLSQMAILAFEMRNLRKKSVEYAARLEKLVIEVAAKKQFEAIARMTEMLAHDVRKPFSILRMGLRMLGGAKDPPEVKKVLSRLVPEIDKAVSSVDGLIADVMEVGSTNTQLIQEPANPESLIEATLGETFRIYPKADIAICYDFKHTQMVNVHVQKVSRVFSNIVGNAVQAMGQKGLVWFKTRESEGVVEFRLGNAGSVIPAENLPKLFEAFFTSGKKGGTGLGLAIAEKVVKAHGGTIWCESAKTVEYPDGYVELLFTLPVAANQVRPYNGKLPNHSSDITKAILALTEPAAASPSAQSAEELKLEANVLSASKKLGRPLKILLVDDEEVYRSGLIGMLTHSPELAAAVAISEATTSNEALGLCESMSFDLAISDVDLGSASPIDGFDLVETLRSQLNAKLRDDAVICVLSNRIVPSDHKTAIAKGADAFISKPISSVALLKLVLQTFQSVRVVEEQVNAAAQLPDAKHRPSIAVLDDNVFILEAWTDALRADSRVFSFASPEDLLETLESDPNFLNSLACVVTDFHFDNSTTYDGADVGKLVKSRRPALAVLLSSDCEVNGLDLSGSIDHVIAKTPASLGTLTERYGL